MAKTREESAQENIKWQEEWAEKASKAAKKKSE